MNWWVLYPGGIEACLFVSLFVTDRGGSYARRQRLATAVVLGSLFWPVALVAFSAIALGAGLAGAVKGAGAGARLAGRLALGPGEGAGNRVAEQESEAISRRALERQLQEQAAARQAAEVAALEADVLAGAPGYEASLAAEREEQQKQEKRRQVEKTAARREKREKREKEARRAAVDRRALDRAAARRERARRLNRAALEERAERTPDRERKHPLPGQGEGYPQLPAPRRERMLKLRGVSGCAEGSVTYQKAGARVELNGGVRVRMESLRAGEEVFYEHGRWHRAYGEGGPPGAPVYVFCGPDHAGVVVP